MIKTNHPHILKAAMVLTTVHMPTLSDYMAAMRLYSIAEPWSLQDEIIRAKFESIVRKADF